MLQILENGTYRPITDGEFDLLKQSRPDIAALFEDESKKEELQMPTVDDSAPILYHWERAARRMMTGIMKHPKAFIFNEEVDPVKLNIPDYFNIITNPMDFGTIEKKLKAHEYLSMQQFLQDVELVFQNAFHYNGMESSVASITKEIQDEYNKLCEQL